MIAVLTDIIQSLAIICWAAITFFLIRQVRRHEMRLDAVKIANELRDAHKAQWEDPQPVCGCEHHQCFHDDGGCHKIDAGMKFAYGNSAGEYYQPCGCKRYTGPEPLPTIIP